MQDNFYITPENLQADYFNIKDFYFGRFQKFNLETLASHATAYGLQDTKDSKCIRQQSESSSRYGGCNFLIIVHIANRVKEVYREKAALAKVIEDKKYKRNIATGEADIDLEYFQKVLNETSVMDGYKMYVGRHLFDIKQELKHYTKIIREEFPFVDTGEKIKHTWSVYHSGILSVVPYVGLDKEELIKCWYANRSTKAKAKNFKLPDLRTKAFDKILFGREYWARDIVKIVRNTTAVTELSRSAYDRKVHYISKGAYLYNKGYIDFKLVESKELAEYYNLPTNEEVQKLGLPELEAKYGQDFIKPYVCQRCQKPAHFNIECWKTESERSDAPVRRYYKEFGKDGKGTFDPAHFLSWMEKQEEWNEVSTTKYIKQLSLRDIEKLFAEEIEQRKNRLDKFFKTSKPLPEITNE